MSAAFVDRERRLRNGWWIAVFLLVLALLLFPAIIVSARLGREITVADQAVMILVATLVTQAMRRKSLSEVTGRLDLRWAGHLSLGVASGAVLMLVPAVILALGGWVDWRTAPVEAPELWSAVLLMAGVAVAEELLFRGVLFQRLIAGVGMWPAQIAIAALFVLTHLGNPGMEGSTKIWAAANIFAASLLFGLAYVRTRSLALPIGMHFMANVTQGAVLGFGVSGAGQPSLLVPHFLTDREWLTGGAFGLEASLPGLLAVVAVVAMAAFARGEAGTAEASAAPDVASGLADEVTHG